MVDPQVKFAKPPFESDQFFNFFFNMILLKKFCEILKCYKQINISVFLSILHAKKCLLYFFFQKIL